MKTHPHLSFSYRCLCFFLSDFLTELSYERAAFLYGTDNLSLLGGLFDTDGAADEGGSGWRGLPNGNWGRDIHVRALFPQGERRKGKGRGW